MMARVWVFLLIAAFVIGVLSGRVEELSNAALAGAGEAVKLCISIGGIICLWTGLMQIMRESGLSDKIAKLLRPILSRLFRGVSKDTEAMGLVASNVSANLLGIANAATPIGLKAASRIHTLKGGGHRASDELIMLIVINSASMQLIPTTVIAIRSSLGSQTPYDILTAVWISSALSVLAGVSAAFLFRKFEKKNGIGAVRPAIKPPVACKKTGGRLN